MKINQKEQAIPFEMEDAFGKKINLDAFKGKKILLSFMRYTGCPVCNFRVHEMIQKKEEIENANVAVILVYESSSEQIRKYVKSHEVPFNIIGDRHLTLYKKYGVEASWGKLFKAFVNPKMLKDILKGTRQFKRMGSMKGTMNRVSADFLIDENKVVAKVHYGKMVGDHIPLEEVIAV